jgi:snRNA-activating protein complex subunit 3
MCGYVFCSVDELKVLSEEELVERALQEAMEVASTDNQLALITLFWIAFSFEALMFFLSKDSDSGTQPQSEDQTLDGG